MGPTWVLSAPDGPHFGPMNLAMMAGNVLLESKTLQLYNCVVFDALHNVYIYIYLAWYIKDRDAKEKKND